jgi:hypothetical protein
MNRLLIAITSCEKHRAWQFAQRQTWIRDIPQKVSYRFFLGGPTPGDVENDEVFLDVPDDYLGLPLKTVGVSQWALKQGFNLIYKTDVDTLVLPTNLIGSGFEEHDYVGGVNTERPPVHFASGGAGYCLSKKAMCLVADSKPWSEGGPEDVWVACVLKDNGILPHDDPRFKFYPGSVLDKDTISYHLTSVRGWLQAYSPDQMFEKYSEAKSL